MEQNNTNMLELLLVLQELCGNKATMYSSVVDGVPVFSVEITTIALVGKEPKYFNCSVQVNNSDPFLGIMIGALQRLLEIVRECKGIDMEYCVGLA